jgi:hypothetical protein
MAVTVERWDTLELAYESDRDYPNPFVDTALSAVFRHRATGRSITVDGFHDGGRTWRVRFMPTEEGEWQYETSSPDRRLGGHTGALHCVSARAPYLHGPLQAEGYHFRHADGTRRYLVSTRVTCQFAGPEVRQAVVCFCAENKLNRVFFIMGGIRETIADLHGGTAERRDFSRYDLPRFQAIDAFIDELRRADIIAGPYFFYFPDGDQRAMTEEQDRAFLRYGMARFGAYCNVMPCLANQVEQKHTPGPKGGGSYDPRNHMWANTMGRYLKERAVFGVPVTVHNPLENQVPEGIKPSYYTLLGDWSFPWADLMLRQAQIGALGAVAELRDDIPEQYLCKSIPGPNNTLFPQFYNPRAYAMQNRLLIDLRRFGIPVVNEEPGYEMKGLGGGTTKAFLFEAWNTQNSESLLSAYWTAATACAYSMWGSSEIYHMGDPLPGMQNSVVPQYLRVLQDFMVELPYWEMEPDNDSVSAGELEVDGRAWRTNFCAAKAGEVYLVYSEYGGAGRISLAGRGSYRATRLNPRIGLRHDLGRVEAGARDFVLPRGEWVLLYRAESGSRSR